jgi:hypothetical protein
VSERTGLAWQFLILGIAVASYSLYSQNPPDAEPADAPAEVFSAGRAMRHVEAIAREPHPTGSDENARVREVILASLREIGLEPIIQEARSGDRPERNILARLAGRGPRGRKVLLLCAHHDSVPTAPGAGDDASGVAVILETLRALKAGPPPDRDVIALIDDGEEHGLVGAGLFVDEHPWAGDVGVVLNFDARGNHGPSIMFETGAENGWLVRQFAAASPHPLATSLSMDIYRIMPNDSDLSVFKRAKLAGLNFAFSRGLAYYHSAEDTPANLDPRSLQHQGENALALARHLGQLDLKEVREEDVVYFSVLNRFVVAYPARLATTAALTLVVFFAMEVGIGAITRRAKLTDVAIGLVACPVAAVTSAFVAGAFWLVLRDVLNNFGLPLLRFDLAILSACAAVTAGVFLILMRLAAAGRSVEALSLGALGWWTALAVVTAAYLPGASYLFTWPALAMLLALGLAMPMRRSSTLGPFVTFLGTLPNLLILPPLAREAFEGLGLWLTTPLMLLVPLFLGAALPLLAPIVARRRPD